MRQFFFPSMWQPINALLLVAFGLLQLSANAPEQKIEAPASAKIALPVEVLGEEGKVVARAVTIDAATAGAVASLWLLVNNLSYQDKASVKINGGPWINLNHSTVEMPDKEMQRGGMVHGGFNTIRVTLPATGVASGENTIQFRFNESDGISIGYRVLKLNLLAADGSKLLSSDLFEEDDPANWLPPYADQLSIDEGKNLWYNAELWTNYLPGGRHGTWYGQQLANSKVMKAKCTSCHTQDGRDLEIFSYSNESIIERAKFHKLTEEQGKKIASYIRSLSTTESSVGRYGRPWNPPYQPGPSLKDKPIEQWAAGAGLEAVLENDRDMLPYLFPDGVSREEVSKAFDSDIMTDRTTLPLAIQFPDWKHWLPIIHPLDAYDKDGYIEDPARLQKPLEGYQTLRDYLEAEPVPDRPKNQLKQKLRDMWGPFRKFHEEGSSSPNHWRTKDGSANAHLGVDVPWELANTSLARLYAVKNFEVVNEFDLQDKAHWWVSEDDQPGERQWPISTYSVFEVPSHFTALNSRNYENQPYATGLYETSAWYNLQFVLNGGNGFVGGTTPTDFNYNNPFISFASESSGILEPLRYFSSVNFMYQIRTWSQSTEPSNQGFRIRFMGPWTMLGMSDSNQRFFDPPEWLLLQLDAVTPGLTRWVLDAMLWQFVEEVEKYDINTWPRVAPHGKNFELDPSTKSSVETVPDGRFDFHWADKMYDIIPRLQDLGADCEVVDRIIDWSKSAWPLIDFEKFKETCSSETCTPVAIDTGSVYKIKTRHDKCISTVSEDSPITQQTCGDTTDQEWLLTDASDGYYYIKNSESNKYLQSPATADDGEAILEGTFTGLDNQKWGIVLQDNCTYAIASKQTYKCLDLRKGLTEDGTKIQQWACSAGVNQQFSFEFVEEHLDQIAVSIVSGGDVTEGGAAATFDISLEGGVLNSTGHAVTGTVTWSGTATNASDYTEFTTFSIPHGEGSTQLQITILDDTEVEDPETLIATISSVSVGQVGSSNSATITITDDDTSEEQVAEGTFYLSIGSDTNATEGSSNATFTISLDSSMTNTSDSAITGAVSWSGTATNGDDYTASNTFSIATGAASTQVTASVVDDVMVEQLETIFATISDVTGAIVSADSVATSNIQDDESGALTISISASGNVTEGASDAVFTIGFDGGLINGMGTTVTGMLTLSGSSSAGSDYTNTTGFSIADGEATVLVNIPVLDDSDVEGQETLVATISDPSVGSVSENDHVSITIEDNDAIIGQCTEEALADSAVYFIETTQGKVFDVARTAATNGNNVRQWDFSGDDNQQWLFEPTGEGYYYLRTIRSGRSLDVPLGAGESTTVRVWDFEGDANQQWEITRLANCKYMISSRSAGLCLQLAGDSDANDTDLQLGACDSGNEQQQFTIVLTEQVEADRPLHQLQRSGEVVIFPNPARTYLNVSIGDQQLTTALRLRVLDLSGRLLIEKTSREVTATVDISELKGGIYLLEMGYNGHEFHRKVWVQD